MDRHTGRENAGRGSSAPASYGRRAQKTGGWADRSDSRGGQRGAPVARRHRRTKKTDWQFYVLGSDGRGENGIGQGNRRVYVPVGKRRYPVGYVRIYGAALGG